jgi:DNA sulfur modification protein DndD
MAKITISSIAIENLGPFRERQALNLKVSAGRPVILIKALNGSGKTTLLTALQIGLYGYKAISGLRRSEYEQLLLGLQRKDAVGQSVIEIGVAVEIGSSQRKLLIRREWLKKSDGLVESLAVFENGVKDFEFSQTWEEFIGSILPAELVQLFLFDGEKIEALANPERLPDLLRRATEVFLGIGGIESLANDLKALERRSILKNKNTSAEFESARDNVTALDAQAKDLETRIQVLSQEQASARNVAECAQRALDKFSTDAQHRGLTAYERAASIRDGLVSSKKRVMDTRARLSDAMSDPTLPIAWLKTLWPQYVEIWERDQGARHAKLLGNELRKRDSRVILSLRPTLSKSVLEALRKALSDDLRSYAAVRSPVGVSLQQEAPPAEVERRKVESQARLRRELSELKTAMSDLDKAEQQIGQIPAEEQISEILRALQEHSRVASASDMHLANLTRKVEEAQSQLSHVQIRLKAAQERLGNEFRDRSLEAKGIEASGRARQAMMVFKERLLASKAQWLSEMITTEFRNLLHKRNLIARVVVDPTTYRVSIEDAKHQELLMDRLSAGERQLLAISVLSALIKERKGRFPVVVDTPLARLDQQHRSSLIKRFFATVSHQVVVLSTDQEVDGLAYKALKPFMNAEYSLDFDDVTGETTIHAVHEKEMA